MKFILSIFCVSIFFIASAQPSIEREVEKQLNTVKLPTPLSLQWEAHSCNSSLSGKFIMDISFQLPLQIKDDSTEFKELAIQIFKVAYGDVLNKYPNYDRVLIAGKRTWNTKILKVEIYIIGKDFYYYDINGKLGRFHFTNT